jgi:hypothetical protein
MRISWAGNFRRRVYTQNGYQLLKEYYGAIR